MGASVLISRVAVSVPRLVVSCVVKVSKAYLIDTCCHFCFGNVLDYTVELVLQRTVNAGV